MAGMVAGGLFNAIAFAGAGYVFHKFDKNGYEKEMKRHKEAMEKLSRDKEKWYEKTVEKKNKMALLRQKLADASKDLDDANEAKIANRNGRFGRPRTNRTEIKRLLRTFRGNENVYERRDRRYRIRVRIFGN